MNNKNTDTDIVNRCPTKKVKVDGETYYRFRVYIIDNEKDRYDAYDFLLQENQLEELDSAEGVMNQREIWIVEPHYRLVTPLDNR